jgi:predicted nucleotidyltransferase component of viral defense system
VSKKWINQSLSDQLATLKLVAQKTGLPQAAIEKDYWVTLVLLAFFSLPPAKTHFAFKGGTSLSKGWQIIERFSEDVDLAIDKEFFGYADEISKNKIATLRKTACHYVSNDLVKLLYQQLSTPRRIFENTFTN